ncbi:MAG: flagellar basal body L-ring protein FlgH [Bryobacterales bacterium]|nr:flagellar basal body L-ring protein FlgH [Bryobacterales bacterium]
MLLAIAATDLSAGWKKKQPAPSPIDRYIEESTIHASQSAGNNASPGSLYGSGSRYSELFRDQRAFQIDDLITVVVSDRASAIARGVTSSSRKTNASGALTALAGALPAAGALANLGALGGDQKLDGQGQTSRETELSTTLSVRVTHVMPNGNLILQGTKDIMVNSERQTVIVRGICRPQDLSPGNTVRSDRLAELEVRIHGKGVVEDAIKRPFLLYRILNGLLPF